jgi:hypothetical protein
VHDEIFNSNYSYPFGCHCYGADRLFAHHHVDPATGAVEPGCYAGHVCNRASHGHTNGGRPNANRSHTNARSANVHPRYCDWVSFIKDVTIPDGTVFAPGESLTKTWRLKNRGTCTWTPDYMLVFASGERLGDTTAVRLPGYVSPGQTVDVSVALTAPDSEGRFVGYWMLRNPSGVLFGYGDNANQAFYVDIRVKINEAPHGTVTGDICYPSEFNPPMTLYFERVGNGQITQFSIAENQMSYSVLLPNGNYFAYAWAPGYNLEGAYVNEDGTLKAFRVQGGQTISGIRICDWQPEHHPRP